MSQPFVDILLGPYLPDLGGVPNHDNPGYLTQATGVRLTPNGYRGMPQFADVAGATTIGGVTSFWNPAFFEGSTTRHFFALNGSDAKIYESQDEGVTWADATPAAGTAPTIPGDFFTFENDVIYVCQARAPIKRALGVAAGTDFSNLGGSPPVANCGAQVRQHIVLGGLVGVDNYAIQTSAIGDHEDWPTPGTADAQAKESIREVLPQSLGIVRQVLGGEKIGIVVQEKGLTRMTYEGGDTVYSFDTYETKVGYGYDVKSRFATDGNLWYWYNDSGFYATDGYSVQSLDDGKIEDAYFLDLFSTAYANVSGTNCLSAHDPHRHLVFFGNHEQDLHLVYNAKLGEFSILDHSAMTGPFVGRSTSAGTLRTFGPTVYNINQTSRKLQSLSALTPSSSNTVIQTGYIELDPGYRFQLQAGFVLGSGGSGTVDDFALSYKTAAKISDCDVSQAGFTVMTPVSSRGEKITSRASSQYVSFRISGGASEEQLIRGIRVYFTRAEPAP